MKPGTTILTIILAALLCGCRPAKWEYKVEVVPNTAIAAESAALSEAVKNETSGDEHLRDAKRDAGEFKLDEISGPFQLYKYGINGWELVAAIPQTETIGDAHNYSGEKFSNVRTRNIILIFKRPWKD